MIETHPGAWAVRLTREDQGLILERDTGAEVAEQTMDWATENIPDTESTDGMRHVHPVEFRDRWIADYYTSDPKPRGWRPHLSRPRSAAPQPTAIVTSNYV